jgi:hypothetical protein
MAPSYSDPGKTVARDLGPIALTHREEIER